MRLTLREKIYYSALLKSKRIDYKNYTIDIRALKAELKQLEKCRQVISDEIEQLQIKIEMSET